VPQFKTILSIAAGATVNNLLAGSPFERVGGTGATVRLYAGSPNTVAADMALGDPSLVVVDFLLGSDMVIQAAAIGINLNGVTVPDDQIAEGVALPGDQITVAATNNNAGARALAIVVDIQNA